MRVLIFEGGKKQEGTMPNNLYARLRKREDGELVKDTEQFYLLFTTGEYQGCIVPITSVNVFRTASAFAKRNNAEYRWLSGCPEEIQITMNTE